MGLWVSELVLTFPSTVVLALMLQLVERSLGLLLRYLFLSPLLPLLLFSLVKLQFLHLVHNPSTH